MHRIVAVAALVPTLALVGGSDLVAQRRGFIIGFGIGAGVTSYATASSNRQSDVGLATDFKIGAQVSKSVQVYYLGRTNWFNSDLSNSTVAAGISAIGVSYVLPTAPVHISGGLGFATFLKICVECSDPSRSGFGVTGGVGWEFADLWLLDVAVTYGKPGDLDVLAARAGISILSH